MAESPELTAIIAYLEANRATYTQAALRQQLINDGANPELVEQGLARVYSSAPPAPPTFAPHNAPTLRMPGPTDDLETIAAYVRTSNLPSAQVKEHLRLAGIDEETTDLAIAKARGFRETGAVQLKPEPRRRGLIFGIAIPMTIINGFLLAALVDTPTWIQMGAGLLLLAQFIGSIYLFVSKKNRPVAQGLLFGCLGPFALATIALTLFFGYCLLEAFA